MRSVALGSVLLTLVTASPSLSQDEVDERSGGGEFDASIRSLPVASQPVYQRAIRELDGQDLDGEFAPFAETFNGICRHNAQRQQAGHDVVAETGLFVELFMHFLLQWEEFPAGPFPMDRQVAHDRMLEISDLALKSSWYADSYFIDVTLRVYASFREGRRQVMEWKPCFVPIEEFVDLPLDTPDQLKPGQGTLSQQGYLAFRAICAELFSVEDISSRLPTPIRVAYLDSAGLSASAFVTPAGQMFVNRARTKALDQHRIDTIWSNELLHLLLDELKTPAWDLDKVIDCPQVHFERGKEVEEFLSDTVSMHVNPEQIGLLVRRAIVAPRSLGDYRASANQIMDAIGFRPSDHIGKPVRQVYEDAMKAVDPDDVLRQRMAASRQVVAFLRERGMIESPAE